MKQSFYLLLLLTLVLGALSLSSCKKNNDETPWGSGYVIINDSVTFPLKYAFYDSEEKFYKLTNYDILAGSVGADYVYFSFKAIEPGGSGYIDVHTPNFEGESSSAVSYTMETSGSNVTVDVKDKEISGRVPATHESAGIKKVTCHYSGKWVQME